MGLFFDVLSAINNPNQQASVSQLETITNSIQQVSTGRGIDAATMQNVMSALGQYVRPALRHQQNAMGTNQLENLLGRVGTGAGSSSLQSLFPPQLQQQMIQGVAEKTGLSSNLLQSMLPTLIPAVLGMLNMGSTKPEGTSGVSNPLLNAFLDSDRDGDTDLGDVLKFSNRFLNSPQ